MSGGDLLPMETDEIVYFPLGGAHVFRHPYHPEGLDVIITVPDRDTFDRIPIEPAQHVTGPSDGVSYWRKSLDRDGLTVDFRIRDTDYDQEGSA